MKLAPGQGLQTSEEGGGGGGGNENLYLFPPKASISLALLATNTILNQGPGPASSSDVPKHENNLTFIRIVHSF